MSPDLGWQQVALRLGVALVLGGALGIEREIHGKDAGLRTHMLVTIGACLFTIVSFTLPALLGMEDWADPTRIAAQIITGVGFLGAGTIIHARGQVHGLTTAASVWLAAAIGMAVGSAFYVGAILATVFGHAVLVGIHHVEQAVLKRRAGKHSIQALMEQTEDLQWVERLALGMGGKAVRWQIVPRRGGVVVRIDGIFRPTDVQGLLDEIHRHGVVRSLRVQRGFQTRGGK